MKNFWLDRKEKVRNNKGIQLQTVSGHSFEMIDEGEGLPPCNGKDYPDYSDMGMVKVPGRMYGWNSSYKEGYKEDRACLEKKSSPRVTACDKKWKRVEMLSNTGFLIMKDDNIDTPLCQHRNYISPDALKPFDFGQNLDNEIEEKRKALVSHQKNFDKLSGDDMKGLNKWLKEYDKLCEAFEESYQKRHPIPGKEYTFTAQDGSKFKGKFQEASSKNINKRTYPYEVIENAINKYKEENGSGK